MKYLGGLLGTSLLAAVAIYLFSYFSFDLQKATGFKRAYLLVGEPLRVGECRHFFLEIVNSSSREINLAALEFDHGSVSAIGDALKQLPSLIAPSGSLVIPCAIQADGPEWGKYLVSVSGLIRCGSQEANLRCYVEFDVFPSIFCKPDVVSIGSVRKNSGLIRIDVDIYHFKSAQCPKIVDFVTSDPSIKLSLQKLSEGTATNKFGRVTIVVDPAVMGKAMSSRVLIKSDIGDGKLIVNGFLDE